MARNIFYFSNPNGYNIAYVDLYHWFSSVVYQHSGIKPGFDIPLGGDYYTSRDSGDASSSGY